MNCDGNEPVRKLEGEAGEARAELFRAGSCRPQAINNKSPAESGSAGASPSRQTLAVDVTAHLLTMSKSNTLELDFVSRSSVKPLDCAAWYFFGRKLFTGLPSILGGVSQHSR